MDIKIHLKFTQVISHFKYAAGISFVAALV